MQRHRCIKLWLVLNLILTSWGSLYAVTDTELALMPVAKVKEQLPILQKFLQQKPNDFTLLKQTAIALHQINRSTPNATQLNEAEGYFNAALKIKPEEPEVLAWLGSLTTLRAKLESNSGKQTFYVKLGTKQLDKAVKLAPANIMVLNVRGYNSLELPVFFKRARLANEDFSKVLALCTSKQASCNDAEIKTYKKNIETAQKLIKE